MAKSSLSGPINMIIVKLSPIFALFLLNIVGFTLSADGSEPWVQENFDKTKEKISQWFQGLKNWLQQATNQSPTKEIEPPAPTIPGKVQEKIGDVKTEEESYGDSEDSSEEDVSLKK